jgi:transposase-like protein
MQQRRKFSREFRERAVQTATEASRPIAQVARELDVSPATLRNWIRAVRNDPAAQLSAPGTSVSALGPIGLPGAPATPTASSAAPASADEFDLGEEDSGNRTGSPTSAGLANRHRVRMASAVTIGANVLLYVAVANPVSAFLLTILFELAMITVLSQAARGSLHSSIYGILLIGGLVIGWEIAGTLYKKSLVSGRAAQLLFGKPTFGRLGGLPQSSFRLAMQMCEQFSIEFAPEDREAISRVQQVSRDADEYLLRTEYIKLRKSDGFPVDQAIQEWREKQWERILSRTYQGVSMRDSYSNSLVWQVFMYRLPGIGRRVGPLIAAGFLVSIWFFTRGGIRSVSYLPALDTVVLTGFLVTGVIFANVTYGFAFIQWEGPSDAKLLAVADAELKSRIAEVNASYAGKVFWPVKVSFGKRYTRLVSNYFIRAIATPLAFFAAASLSALLLCAAFGILGSHGPGSQWYYYVAAAVVAIPALMLLTIYLAFTILQAAGSLVSMTIATLILAATPLIVASAISGQPPGKAAVVSSIIAGAAGALATTFADRVKERVQRANA